ncbi:MAG: glycosyltransferase family 39 protein [Candidatus Hodarchaeota archaeon]
MNEFRKKLFLKLECKKLFWLEILFIIIVTVFASLVRFYKLGDWSLWIDEVCTIHNSMKSFNAIDSFKLYGQARFFPIGYLIVKAAISFFGLSVWSTRFFPCLAGIISIPVFYWVFKQMTGKVEAGLGCIFLALSSWHIFWSQSARYYSLLMLCSMIDVYLFYRGFEKDESKTIFSAGFLLVFSIFIHYSAIFLLVAFISYIIVLLVFRFERPAGLNLKNVIIFLLPIILSSGVMLPKLVNRFIFFTSPALGYKFWPGRNPAYPLMSLTYYIGVPIIVSTFFISLFLIIHKNRIGLLMSCYVFIPMLLLSLFALVSVGGSCKLFFTLPGYLILTAIGCNILYVNMEKGYKIITVSFIMIIFITLISQNYLYYTNEYAYRKRWKEAVYLVKQQMRSGDTIFAIDAPVINYYLGVDPLNLLNNKTEKVTWLNFFSQEYIFNDMERKWFLIDDDITHLYDRDYTFGYWLSQNCSLIKEFPAWTSAKNRTVKVYLHSPKIKINR